GGGPKGIVKRVLRKFMRWYVEPLASDQRVFNDSVLKLLDALSESADSAATAREQAERLVRELQERLERLERRGSSVGDGAQPPMTVASQPAAAAVPDYFAFESRMRGSTDAIRERQRRYVDDLRESAPVLDIGCGRGELLGLLREAGIEARGIDADADMAAYASGEGLDVEQADLVEYLERVHAGSLGGIFMGQVVEHLPAAVLVQALRLAASKLRPGGVLIAETINPLSPIALRNYFADLTHAQPLVPETLELLARQAGFAATEIRFLNEPANRLTEPDDPVIAANVRRLNELIFAPLDYALVARTATDA
ncbi:MAG: methyltransferase domain-containing protein, partial [Gaiellaceae bacterium]